MQRGAALRMPLAPFRRRIRLLLAEQMALTGGAAAAFVCLLLVAMSKLLHILHADWLAVLSILAAGLSAGAMWGAVRPLSDFDIARSAEDRMRLKERVSSAISLGPRCPGDPMVEALVQDAAEKLACGRPSHFFPHRLGARGRIFVGLAVLLAAALILPELPFLQSPATRRERAALRKEGEEVVKLAQELEKRRLPTDRAKIVHQLAMNVKALGKDMQRLRVTRKQALVRLHKLEKQAQSARAQLLSPSAKTSLAKAAAALQGQQEERARQTSLLSQLQSQQAAAAQGKAQPLSEEQRRRLEELSRSLKPSQARQLLGLDGDLASVLAQLLAKQDVQAALDILARLAQKLEDPGTLDQLSPEELRRLEEELRGLAEALKNTDLDELARELLEMAKALERGDRKLCQSRAGRLGKACLGLSAGLGACNSAQAGLSLCLSGLSQAGQGVGPDQGTSRYDPSSPHRVNAGAPSRVPTQHYDTRIPGQLGERGEAYSLQVLGEPDKPGQAQVPYYQVYSDYSKAAEDAVNREEIPAPFRERVKTYFESLDLEKQ